MLIGFNPMCVKSGHMKNVCALLMHAITIANFAYSVSMTYVTKVTFLETRLKCRQIRLMSMNQILYFSIAFFVARFDIIVFCF